MRRRLPPARKEALVRLEVSFRHSRPNCVPSPLGQLKLNWPPGLSLNDHGALGDPGTLDDIALTLIQSPSEYEPLFYERRLRRKLITIVDEWCYGYLKGVALDEPSWAPLQRAHPEWFEAINLFGSLDHHDRRTRLIERQADADARHQQWVDRIVPAVMRIHAYWLEKRTPAPGEIAGRRKPKENDKVPGRDALCPCGSGKNYKQCHGSPRSLH